MLQVPAPNHICTQMYSGSVPDPMQRSMTEWCLFLMQCCHVSCIQRCLHNLWIFWLYHVLHMMEYFLLRNIVLKLLQNLSMHFLCRLLNLCLCLPLKLALFIPNHVTDLLPIKLIGCNMFLELFGFSFTDFSSPFSDMILPSNSRWVDYFHTLKCLIYNIWYIIGLLVLQIIFFCIIYILHSTLTFWGVGL